MAPDGRFLFHALASTVGNSEEARSRIVVVHHWLDELTARVPTAPRQD